MATPATAPPADRRRSTSLALLFTTIVTVFVMLVAPFWITVVAVVLLPWVAVAAAIVMRDGFRIFPQKDDPRPTLWVPLFVPGVMLAAAASAFDVQLLNWNLELPAIVVVGGLLFLGTRIIDDTDGPLLAVIAVLCLVYVYGATMKLDLGFDRSSPTVYRSRVVGQHWTTKNGMHYYLRVGSVGPVDGDDVLVGQHEYETTRIGDPYCASVYPGALRIPWLRWGRCRP